MILYPSGSRTTSASNKLAIIAKADGIAMKSSELKPVVVTVVEPFFRGMIDLALQPTVQSMHADSVAGATQMVAERFSGVVFVSPSFLETQPLLDLQRLISLTPGYTVAAVVRDQTVATSNMLLRLGSLGVKSVVDISVREGWGVLRDTATSHGNGMSTAISVTVFQVLESSTPGARRFFVEMARVAPSIRTARAFCSSIGLKHSTVLSRFFRAKLPSPKIYISMFRLIHLAKLLENPAMSLAAATRRLCYSSPQSLSRHLRTTLNMPPGEFRKTFTGTELLDHTMHSLFAAFVQQFEQFDPFRE